METLSWFRQLRRRVWQPVAIGAFALLGILQTAAFGQGAVVWDGGTGNWFGLWQGDTAGFGGIIPSPTPTTNWLCEVCYPGAGDTANIGTLFGTVPANGTAILNSSITISGVALGLGAFGGLQVTGGTLTLTGGVTVGTTLSGSGSLTISGAVVNTGFAWLGQLAGTSGGTTVSGPGQLNISGSDEFLVGRAGSGTLSIQSGGVVTSNNAVIGELSGSSGTANVAGLGAQWNDSGILTLGQSGNASLTIASAGAVNSANGVIAQNSGSVGNVLVTGAGSQWNNGGQMVVGYMGSGTLNIASGGLVSDNCPSTCSATLIGDNVGGSGTVTVSGPGSTWNNVGQLTVGNLSNGTLNITNGGLVSDSCPTTCSAAVIGYNAGVSGTVKVSGAGSMWNNNNGVVNVGNIGNGSLAIDTGGQVSAGVLLVGTVLGSSGTVTINSGGQLTDTSGYIANQAGSAGTVTVSGPGSQWSNSGQLIVGVDSSGALNIANGGLVSDNCPATCSAAIIGDQAGSAGAVTVSGAGSKWNSVGQVTIGNLATGTLTINNGGLVSDNCPATCSAAIIGYNAGINGTVTVSGAGSTWNNNGVVNVGYIGNGSLTIDTGGQVSAAGLYIGTRPGSFGALAINSSGQLMNNGAASIGFNTGSVGTVTVSGSGSQWNNSGVVTLGTGGTLTLSSGGTGSSTALEIGGAMTVTGAGSKWTATTGDAVVGQSTSPGTLTIASGGILNNAGNSFIGLQGGTATVTGSGSQWNSASLTVGYAGRGTLNIQNGGVVSTSGSTLLSTFGGTGNIIVDGAGSQLIASGHFDVGNSGPGTLVIQNGGVANSNGGLVGTNAGGVGAVTVTGAGSQWNNSGTLTIGQSGAGAITINSGGQLTSTALTEIGLSAGSSGVVAVAGPGSKWTANEVWIGVAGSGALNISGGGVVSDVQGCPTCDAAVIGQVAGGRGAVTVSGTGSVWNNGGVVAIQSDASLIINAGGQMNSSALYIGTLAGSLGAVTVSDPGSQLNNSGQLIAGFDGSGALNIANGGVVNDASAIVGYNSGSTGNVLVDAGTWTTTGTLDIGVTSAGSVTVLDSGVVSAGTTTIGSFGSLTVDPSIVGVSGNFTLSPGGVLSLAIAGIAPDFSQLDISGTGLFQGTIDFDFIDGFAPLKGESFDLINVMRSANFSGATIQIEGLAPGFQYTDTFSGGQFTLVADNNGVSTSAPEPNFAWLLGGILIALSITVLRKKAAAKF